LFSFSQFFIESSALDKLNLPLRRFHKCNKEVGNERATVSAYCRCENVMTCPIRPIGSGNEHCPFDWLAVYDGRDEHSPLIGKFCGLGKFPFSIIGEFSGWRETRPVDLNNLHIRRHLPVHVCGVCDFAGGSAAQHGLPFQRWQLARPCGDRRDQARGLRLAPQLGLTEGQQRQRGHLPQHRPLVPAEHLLQLPHQRTCRRDCAPLLPQVGITNSMHFIGHRSRMCAILSRLAHSVIL